MNLSLDHFLDREYSFSSYNCGHFVMDVWMYLTGEDISTLMGLFFQSGLLASAKLRNQIETPKSPCFVVMQRKHEDPHIGVFYKDRVIHLTEQGPIAQTLHALPKRLDISFYD